MATSDESLVDHQPDVSVFLEDVLQGLGQSPRHLPSKYFYDSHGCQLFDQICELDEYYLTRTELAIMDEHATEMAGYIGRNAMLVELGSGSGIKTRLLLDQLPHLVAYVPVDIARAHLLATVRTLEPLFPNVEILPVCADFCQPFELPQPKRAVSSTVFYLPGSTIGNFAPREARRLLAQIAKTCGPGGGLLIGIDLQKDPRVLEAAYNDRFGVTAEFNQNLLCHINRELGANFEVSRFQHQATYNSVANRIEMYLVSRGEQTVSVAGHEFEIADGEAICTEYSHKYDAGDFLQVHGLKEFRQEKCWTDRDNRFALLYLRTAAD